MTVSLKDLYINLQYITSQTDEQQLEKIPVCVPVFNLNAIGPAAVVKAKSIGMGFDWNSGKFFINPVSALRVIEADEIKVLSKEYNELVRNICKERRIIEENEDLKLKSVTEIDKRNQLFDLCKKYCDDHEISCAEMIYDTDDIITDAYEFIEKICDIVGYYKHPEDTL